MMHDAREASVTLVAAIEAARTRRQKPARLGMELLHLFVFHATGELTRDVYGEDHVPHARARGLYARLGALLRADLSEDAIGAIWRQRGAGAEAIAELLLDRASLARTT